MNPPIFQLLVPNSPPCQKNEKPEIDIIATKGGMTHVVEVKTRNQADQITLPELVKRHQERSIIEAADAYAKLHPSPLGVQIDIMLILVHPYKPSQIEYYPDAIRPMF